MQRLEHTRKLFEQYVEEALDGKFQKLDEIIEKTKLETNPDIVNKEERPKHIDFDPKTKAQSAAFGRHLNKRNQWRSRNRHR